MNQSPRPFMRALLDAAIESARPERCVPLFLPEQRDAPLVVIGAGKAAAAMARAVEAHWRGPLCGVVVTRDGYGVACERVEVLEAAHPVPDARSVLAAERILREVRDLGADDHVLCLLSGGGSALMCLPGEGLTLADKQAVNAALLRSGANIHEMNCVRRHLSRIKGGRLARAVYPARFTTLMISDVPGDDPVDIASGPTIGDATTCTDALTICTHYGIALPPAARQLLGSGAGESVKPNDACFARAKHHIVAAPGQALQAAERMARASGYEVLTLGDAITGEARDVAQDYARLAREIARGEGPVRAPCVVLSGGELSVTVRGDGVGGRNVEYLNALAIALDGASGIHALAADTDGVDGARDVAGAMISPDTLARARALGLDAADYLARNDAHTFFAALGDQVITGPTRTNVNDFRALLIVPPV